MSAHIGFVPRALDAVLTDNLIRPLVSLSVLLLQEFLEEPSNFGEVRIVLNFSHVAQI